MRGNICDTHRVHDISELKQHPTKVASDKVYSMIQWMSGTNVSGHVFMPKEGTLSI